jgi:hypothetical protein
VTIQDFGSIGELIGAIATVATLAYLALQIRANTRISKSAALQAMLDGSRDRIVTRLSTDPTMSAMVRRGLNSYHDLDEDERLQFTFFMVESVLHMQNVMQLHHAGLISDVDQHTWLIWTASLLRTPGGQAAWPQIQNAVTPTITQLLEKHFSDEPDGPTVFDLMPVFLKS